MRFGYLMLLKWDKIREEFIEFTQHKTGNSERLPLAEQAIKILEDQRSIGQSAKIKKCFDLQAVFYMPRQSTTDKALKRKAQRAELRKNISFYKARHTFATMA